jgi:hypothetical protein
MVVLLDHDDTLHFFNESMQPWHERNYKVKKLETWEITDYRFHKLLECNPEECARRIIEFYASEEFLQLKPISGAHRALQAMHEKDTLVISTRRPSLCREASWQQVERDYPGLITEILFHDDHLNGMSCYDKATVALKLGARFAVDDNIDHCNNYARAGVPVALYTHHDRFGWNSARNALDPRVVVCKTMEEVLEAYQAATY